MLGNSNLEVSAIGPACMSMSYEYGPPSDKQVMIKLSRMTFDKGATFSDTAQVYSPFQNEKLVGTALVPIRDQMVIAAKFGIYLDEDVRIY